MALLLVVVLCLFVSVFPPLSAFVKSLLPPLFCVANLYTQDALKLAVTKRMLLELRRLVPECSVALLAPEEDVPFYRNLAFAADQNGVRLMALQEENWDITI